MVLANPGYTAAELGHLVADSGARAGVADPGPAQRLSGWCGRRKWRGAAGRAGRPVWAGWPEDAGWAIVPATDRHGEAPAGRRAPCPPWRTPRCSPIRPAPPDGPRAFRSPTGSCAASIRAALAAWRWTAGDVLVHALPLFHQHGLGGVHATLVAGSTAHIRSRFGPADLIATVRAAGGTVLFGVPATYQALLDSAAATYAARRTPSAGPAAPAATRPSDRALRLPVPLRPLRPGRPLLPSLRLAVCGSAPLSPALAARLPGLLGRLPLIRYGTTETGLDVSNPVGAPRPDTVGLPLPGVECRIWSAGREAPPGTDGEIQLRGPQVFTGYWHDARATAEAFTADGWFRTGDLGAIDPACGHLVIRGRTKELIISGGLNVYPREVEIALEQHPSVAEAAVAALPHPRWGEQVTAWIVPRPGATVSEAELVAHARTLLAAYKCPKQVFALAALPRNQMGKLNRAALTASRPPPGSPAPSDPHPPRPLVIPARARRLHSRHVARGRSPAGARPETRRQDRAVNSALARHPGQVDRMRCVAPAAGEGGPEAEGGIPRGAPGTVASAGSGDRPARSGVAPGLTAGSCAVSTSRIRIWPGHEPSAKLIFGIPSCQHAALARPAWACAAERARWRPWTGVTVTA